MSAAGGTAYKDRSWLGKVLMVWTHDGSEYFAKWLDEWCFDPVVVMPVFFLFLLWAAEASDPQGVLAVIQMLVATSPLWLPVGLFVFFWVTWMHYIRFAFWFGPICESVLLEIQLPPEVEKTPLAMETFFTAIWNTGGETTFRHRVWRGQTRPVFSLEIASNHGQVRFYIHMRKVWRTIVEARLYGQFPTAQVREVEDYVTQVPFNWEEYDLWGTEYNKKIACDALPIRTYVDFQMDKSPDKPENQIDPITNIVELLGSIGKDEHFWMQLIVMGHKKDEWYGFYLANDKYRDDATKYIKSITQTAIDRAKGLVEDEAEKKKVGTRGAMLMTEVEKRQVEAIERSLTKLTFEVGIRTMYIARKERYNGINNASIIRFFDTFNPTAGYNYINRIGTTRGVPQFDYPWQDFMGIRERKVKNDLLFHYKHRAYFFVPYDQDGVHMSTEELATLWHFPSSVVVSPSLDRVPAKVSQAPTNLPTAPPVAAGALMDPNSIPP